MTFFWIEANCFREPVFFNDAKYACFLATSYTLSLYVYYGKTLDKSREDCRHFVHHIVSICKVIEKLNFRFRKYNVVKHVLRVVVDFDAIGVCTQDSIGMVILT